MVPEEVRGGIMERLSRQELGILLWMYQCTESWKGGTDPTGFAEYDVWLKEARDLLEKLGVKAKL